MRALHAHHAPARSPTTAAFDLWRIPGRKCLEGSGDAVLTTAIGTRHARILLDAGGELPVLTFGPLSVLPC